MCTDGQCRCAEWYKQTRSVREVGMALRPFHSMVPAALGAVLLNLPMSSLPLGELQALNRELGRLCSSPPKEALTVCRLHARLVRTL
jgi:hypothetical protein